MEPFATYANRLLTCMTTSRGLPPAGNGLPPTWVGTPVALSRVNTETLPFSFVVRRKLRPLIAFTVALATTSPPGPVHVSVKLALPTAASVTVSVPLADFAPFHAPLAVQPVASVDDQVSVVEFPAITVDEADVSTAVGGGTLTVTVATEFALPPAPVQVNV